MAQEYKRVTVSATSCGFDFYSGDIFFSLPRSGNELQNSALSSATQHASRIRQSGQQKKNILKENIKFFVISKLSSESVTENRHF